MSATSPILLGGTPQNLQVMPSAGESTYKANSTTGGFPNHVQSYEAIVMSNTIRQLLSTRATSEPANGNKVTHITIGMTSGKW